MNADIYQPMPDSDGMVDATSIVVNKIEESVTVLVDSNTPVSPKPVQVRKISRFQVSHVQEDTIPKINPVPYITPVEVKLKCSSARNIQIYQLCAFYLIQRYNFSSHSSRNCNSHRCNSLRCNSPSYNSNNYSRQRRQSKYVLLPKICSSLYMLVIAEGT